MPNKNYIKGRQLEYEVMEFLDERDYQCFRSAGSHGLADVTAFNRRNNDLDVDIGLMYLWVSCKRYTGKMTVQEKKDFVLHARNCGVVPVEATRQPRKHIVFKDLNRNIQLFK